MLGIDARVSSGERTVMAEIWTRDGAELIKLIFEKVEIMIGQNNLPCSAAGKTERLG